MNLKTRKLTTIIIIILIAEIIGALFILFNYRNRPEPETAQETSQLETDITGVSDRDNPAEIPVITYHRLCSDEYAGQVTEQKSLWTSVSSFREEMKYLHDEGYTTLSLDEFYAWHNEELNVPAKSVVITFDDGHYNVIKYGLPILKEYKMKATMFVIGENSCFKADPKEPLSTVGIEDMVEVSEEYPDFRFQSHTYKLHNKKGDNPIINSKSYDAIMKDFKIQDSLYAAYDFKYVAYPYGVSTEDFIKAAQDSGYIMGFSYGNPERAVIGEDPMMIPRIGIRGDLPIEQAFYKWFKG